MRAVSYIFSYILISVAVSVSKCQEVSSLSIGDTLPEHIWQLPLQVASDSEAIDTLRLKKHQGKLIILDFWATWCTACVKDFPKKLNIVRQMQYPTVLLPITREPKDKVSTFLSKQQVTKDRQLVTVINDTLLKRLFPHRFIPHYVIIHPKGYVAAYLAAQHVTRQNLTALLSKSDLNAPTKDDSKRAYGERSLLDIERLPTEGKVLYHSTITDEISDIGYASGNKVIGDNRRFYFYNRPVAQILEFAFETRLKHASISDLRLTPDSTISKMVCYELWVPKDSPIAEIRKMMAQDIGRYLNAEISFEDAKLTLRSR